jgi:cyclopropane fatty-acyl-phospholipid synthase-like methyltransferase
MGQAQAHIAPLALNMYGLEGEAYRLDLGFGAGSLSVAAAL